MPSGGSQAHDPFEGLVLDEDFIRGARHTEFVPPPRRRKRRFGWLLLAVVAAGGVGVAVTQGGGHSSGNSPSAAATPSARTVSLVDQAYLVGHCYTWDQHATLTPAEDVPCTQPHLFQAAGQVTLGGYPIASHFPTDDEWAAIARRECLADGQGMIGHVLDPGGRFAVGGIHPGKQGWAAGDRTMQCGINAAGTAADGAPANLLESFSVDARTARQDVVLPTGTCEQLVPAGHPDAGTIEPVTCSSPHTDEVIGTFRAEGADTAYPATTKLDAAGFSGCKKFIKGYLGHAFTNTTSEYVTYDPPSSASWATGDRTVTCFLQLTSPRTGSLQRV